MIKKILKTISKLIFPDDAVHFHQNLLSKHYYPIYISFFFFAIIYSIQYTLKGFMWKRIIFAFTLGSALGLAILIGKIYFKITQVLLTFAFIFCSIMVDILVIEELKNHEMLYLGIYISLLFFNLIKGASNLLSTIAFSSMLLYLSFRNLFNTDDLITLFANITISGLQCYMIVLDKKAQEAKIQLKIKEKEKWQHIFSKIISGVTILLAPEKNYKLKLELVNSRGLNEYHITDISTLSIFLNQIQIINCESKSTGTNHLFTNKLIKEMQLNLWEFLNSQTKDQILMENILDTQENAIMGIYLPNSKKLKISLSTYFWDLKPMIFIHVDDENFEDQIKFLKENDAKKNDLLASVTHDLRSPLNGILAFISNAMETNDLKQQMILLNYAKINGNLLMSLINDILDYSSFINDKFHLNEDEFDLNELLNEVFELMKVQAEWKKLDFQINNVFKSESKKIISDARRLKQILINMIGNSIKFTMKGFIKLSIKKSEFPNVLKFQVKDSGVGISAENINKLFKPYATFDTENGLNKYGIGLGLNICKKFSGLLGPKEELIVKSKLGIGTKIGFLLYENNIIKNNKNDGNNKDFLKFKKHPKSIVAPHSLNLQRTRSENNNIQFLTPLIKKSNHKTYSTIFESEKKKDENHSMVLFTHYEEILEETDCINHDLSSYLSQKKKNIHLLEKKDEVKIVQQLNFKKMIKIMTVDDNSFNNFVIKNFLKKFNQCDIDLIMANNGLECIEMYKKSNFINNIEEIPFNIILMDCIMPIKDGYVTTEEIRSLIEMEDYYNVYIVGISGLSGDEEEEKCLNCGMDKFLSKPINDKDLLNIVQFYYKEFIPT